MQTALVLGGGAARGIAHAGIWKQFEEAKKNVEIITGTSMGAVIGGFIASGRSYAEMLEILNNIPWLSLMSFPSKGVIMNGDGLTKFFHKYFGETKIEDLPIKFACIATNIDTGEECVFDSGSLVEALRASVSIPGVLRPFEKNGVFLVDGGLTNNLPILQAEKMGAEVIYAINVRKGKKRETLYAQFMKKDKNFLDWIKPQGPKLFYDALEKSYEILGDCIDQRQIKGISQAKLNYISVNMPQIEYKDFLKWKDILNAGLETKIKFI